MIESTLVEKIDGDKAGQYILETRDLCVFAGNRKLLQDVNLRIVPHQVFGLIGPSGAGKSTLLRCLNRLIELDHGLRVEGEILLHGRSIYSSQVNVDHLRVRLGMLFQQAVVFPVSILKNVLFGVRHHRAVPRAEWTSAAEQALREATLWDEVKDRLQDCASKLSLGQQQRLCLARTLAVNPEVILMDEPTSALDPKSTQAIEELIGQLKTTRTIILVTHHLGQAHRLCDEVAFVSNQSGGIGRIACSGPVAAILESTDLPELKDFLCSGKDPVVTCCVDGE